MAYKTTYGGAVYLTFNESQIMLTAADLKLPRFSYVAESFYTAVSLGKIDTAVGAIADKFESGTGINIDAASIKKQIGDLTNIPVLNQILTSELIVTEFVIQPETDKKNDAKYSFGIGLRLTQNNKLGPVSLDGVSFNINLSQEKA